MLIFKVTKFTVGLHNTLGCKKTAITLDERLHTSAKISGGSGTRGAQPIPTPAVSTTKTDAERREVKSKYNSVLLTTFRTGLAVDFFSIIHTGCFTQIFHCHTLPCPESTMWTDTL